MYVGLTRAQEKLYLSYARRRLYFGARQNNPPSRFLTELPPESVEFVKRSDIWENKRKVNLID